MSNQCNKEVYRELLEDICAEYCEKDHYCILKEFLVNAHSSARLLMQMKCIDRFKYERSKELDKDLGWEGALAMWLEEGYAKKFGDMYEEGIRFSTLYKKVRNGDAEKK